MFNREYVFRTLREERLWKSGESDSFEYTTSNGNTYKVTLERKRESYAPFKYGLSYSLTKSTETGSVPNTSTFCKGYRNFKTMDDAFLFIVNDFNECSDKPRKYDKIEKWLLKD